MTKTMYAAAGRLGRCWTALGAALATQLSMAQVNDLPGGPAVNQLDMHPARSPASPQSSTGCTTSCW